MSSDHARRGQHYFDRGVDTFGDAFYPLYRRLFRNRTSFVDDLGQKLAEARLPYNVELYLAMALGGGILGGLLLWFVGVFAGYVLFVAVLDVGPLLGISVPNQTLLTLIEAARVPFLVGVTGIVFGLGGFIAGFGSLVLFPYSRAARRRREINLLLPDAVSFMYALSIGGMNQLEILESIASAEDAYGEVAKEFGTILLETEYFDTDYRTAIREQSIRTPSEDLSQFLTDLLSVIDSGGDLTRFLDDKKNQHFRTAKQEQQRIIETLELFGEVYITLSLFPLLLIILLVILSILGQTRSVFLYATVYGLIPLSGVAFLLIVSTVKQDEPGDGVLKFEEGTGLIDGETSTGLRSRGLIERFTGRYYLFDRIKEREGTHRTVEVIRRPHVFLRENPTYTLALTVPASVVLVGVAVAMGMTPTSWGELRDSPVWGTFIYAYVPLITVGTPLAVFYEWNVRSRRGVLNNLSDNLRKLSSANDTGLTLLESLRNVADTSSGKFAEEMEVVYTKSTYGMNLRESLVVFNNRYRLPRLARTIWLITKAQEASSQISSVLTTAAQATENQDDIERERRSSTRLQVTIILMTYLTLLGVMAVLKTQFIDVMADVTANSSAGTAASFASTIDTNRLSLLFFHAVTLQSLTAGLICGYIRTARLLTGVKYVVGLLVVTLGTWVVVG